MVLSVRSDDGSLQGERELGGAVSEIGLMFCRGEDVLVEGDDGSTAGSYRANFARDQACNIAYPDLEARFIALPARLRTEPVISKDGVPIIDRDLINRL
jgi:hypothetical protein